MFEQSDTPRCYALPPGCDFSACFINGLRARAANHPPEALAHVEVFVNTHRTGRRLHDLFMEGPAGFLPRIRVISDLAHDTATGSDIPPATPPLRRRLELARTVAALLDKAPHLAPRSAVFDLAQSLQNLMDEMHIEGVHPDVLASLAGPDHAEHWGQSLRFLNILGDYFKGDGAPGVGARQRLVVEFLIQKWHRTPPDHPIIIAGSTGSRGATALLMQAVASLPQGAVVLPGFDFDMPARTIEALTGPEAAGDHPQTGLVRLIQTLGLDPSDVDRWTNTAPPHPDCNRLVSLALRPAPVTDQWLEEGPSLADPVTSTRHLDLLEAPTPRDESLAIALRLRAALNEGRRATLITPDRQLTRRVTAALQRWSLIPDDSAGHPLALSPVGIFLRLCAGLFTQRLSADVLVTILKHPVTHSGHPDRNLHLLRSRDLELEFLRGGGPFPDFHAIEDWAAKRVTDPKAAAWAGWLARCFDQQSDTAVHPLSDWLTSHLALAEKLAAGPGGNVASSRLWRDDAGEKAAGVLEELRTCADAGGEMNAPDYAALMLSLLQRAETHDTVTSHPDITIWGTLEARVQGADLVILGGMNEGVWPGLPAPDPWLSRTMRTQARLLLPERQIGLAAHDFQQAIGANDVLITRAIRDADAPTLASRWLIRLTNLLAGLGKPGTEALDDMRARGQHWCDLATALETPRRPLRAETRPSPRPPIEARPQKLSVTQFKTLIRDPYAIYARKVLGLRRLDPIRTEPNALLRGQALHAVLEHFIDQTWDDLPENANQLLMKVAAESLSETAPWPATRRLWLARLAGLAEWFAEQEATRRLHARPLVLEQPGKVVLANLGFTLTCKADRIDLRPDGSLVIYDYKSGTPPTQKQVEHFDLQLPLEAGIAQRGGFGKPGKAKVAALEYIGLGSGGTTTALDLSDDLVGKTWEGLQNLIRAYSRLDVGYTARARLENRKDTSDYDHLSRLGEWDDSDMAAPNSKEPE